MNNLNPTQLLDEHIGFVKAEALKVSLKYGVEFDDLVQEGLLGILKAASMYQRQDGATFLSYAAWRVRSRMMRWVMGKAKVIRVPEGKFYTAHVSTTHPSEAVNVWTTEETASHSADLATLAESMARELQRMPEQQQIVLRRVFWEEKTEREIAAELGVSHTRVHQIKGTALAALRRSDFIEKVA